MSRSYTRLSMVAALVLLCGLASGLQANTISYWRFEGDLNDSVGGHHITNNSGVGFTESGLWNPVPNPDGNVTNGDQNSDAADFGGTDVFNYAYADDSDDWTQSGGFTIEAMVNVSGFTEDSPETLVSHWNSLDQEKSWVFEINDADAPQLRLSGNSGDAVAAFSASEFSLETGKTYALAAAFDGSEVTFFGKEKGVTYDGKQYLKSDPVDVSSIGILNNASEELFFGMTGDSSNAFGGTMDEVRFSSGALGEADLLATPEPATTCLALAAAAAGVFAVWRKKRKENPEEDAA